MLTAGTLDKTGNLTSVAFLPKLTTQVQTGDGGSWTSDPRNIAPEPLM